MEFFCKVSLVWVLSGMFLCGVVYYGGDWILYSIVYSLFAALVFWVYSIGYAWSIEEERRIYERFQ